MPYRIRLNCCERSIGYLYWNGTMFGEFEEAVEFENLKTAQSIAKMEIVQRQVNRAEDETLTFEICND